MGLVQGWPTLPPLALLFSSLGSVPIALQQPHGGFWHWAMPSCLPGMSPAPVPCSGFLWLPPSSYQKCKLIVQHRLNVTSRCYSKASIYSNFFCPTII